MHVSTGVRRAVHKGKHGVIIITVNTNYTKYTNYTSYTNSQLTTVNIKGSRGGSLNLIMNASVYDVNKL